jgi:hypothetical protein
MVALLTWAGCQRSKVWQRSCGKVFSNSKYLALVSSSFSVSVYIFIHYSCWTLSNFFWITLFQLIRRRYFSDELPAPSPWSAYPVQRSVQRLDENTSDEDPFYKTTRYPILMILLYVARYSCQLYLSATKKMSLFYKFRWKLHFTL